VIDKHFYALLTGNSTITTACSRIYSIAAPADVDMPLITYQEIDADGIYTWDGASDLLNSSVDVDVWAQSKKDVAEIAYIIWDEFKDYRGAMGTKTIIQCEAKPPYAAFYPQTKSYGATIELSIWYH